MSERPPKTDTQVLVALDGSPAAAAAWPVAVTVAAQLGAEPVVLHVPSSPLPLAQLRKRALRHVAANLPLRRENAETAVAGVLRALADPRVALVVLTTHGREIEPGRGLGSVAESVIAWTSRPILIVRPEMAKKHPARKLHYLLVPLDGSPTTATVLRPAIDLACRLGASIDLLYVASPTHKPQVEAGSIGAPRYVDQAQHEWPAWGAEVIERLGGICAQIPPGLTVQMYLASGEVGHAIVQFAVEHNADAIVLARRSHLEPGRAKVLRAVLAQTPVPVLLVGADVGGSRGDRKKTERGHAAIGQLEV